MKKNKQKQYTAREYKIKKEEDRTEPPVAYSHPKSFIVMIHMMVGTNIWFHPDASSHAGVTSESCCP